MQVFDESDLPSYVNWVEAGAVTPVKDQLHCGSCWAFSAVGALESAHFIASGELLSFSEQQLIDCDIDAHCDGRLRQKGCHGGNMGYAFDYFEHNFAMLKDAYPYASGDTKSSGDCLYSASKATNVKVVKSLRPLDKFPGSEGLKYGIQQQPVSVAIAANNKYIH